MTNEEVSYTDLVAKLRAHSERDNCVSHDWGETQFDAGEDCFAAANVIEQLMRDIEELTCGDPRKVCPNCRGESEPTAPQNSARSVQWICPKHGTQWGEYCPYCSQSVAQNRAR